MADSKPKYDLDGWEPTPGFVLCRPINREEMQRSDSKLSLPDKVGKVSDSVGVGEVILKGLPMNSDLRLDLLKLEAAGTISKETMHQEMQFTVDHINVGDLVAWMPFMDTPIEIKLKKYTLIPYDKIRAVRKAK